MSDSITKYYEDSWNQQEPIRHINNTLTPQQAQQILTMCILKLKDEKLIEDVEKLKHYLKSITNKI
jgi:hypothetical protein